MNDPQPQRLFDDTPEEQPAGAGHRAQDAARRGDDGNEPRPVASDEAGAPQSFLDGLNDAQLAAVTHRGGHCLVLAGAGSGKTRVLTHRIAWLIAERGVEPSRICALTFTNKAAAEMRGRVRRLVGRDSAGVWLSTFHALGLRLLRTWSEAVAAGAAADLGLPAAPAAGGADWLPPAGFPVYDRDASLSVWRRCQAALRISPREYDPGRQMGRCSKAMSRLEDPASWDDDHHGWERRLAGRVWKQYRSAMRAAGAVDFDDLLVLPLQLLSRHAELRRRTAARFDHILVDEYQDTNRLQYRLVRTLLAADTELMVVGDEDQSIYRWRGADLDNVLDFQKDFSGAAVVRLEQNYRSTQPILSAAGSLVSNNRQRLGKSLWTELEGGEPPSFVQCATDREEAEWVADKIGEIDAEPDGPARSDIAVLYRTNAQSRQFEETFIRRRIPHLVVGGQRFFARREVRDVLAWLQLLVRDDDVALRRAISAPSRGIGPKTLESLAAIDDDAPAAGALRRLAAHEDPGTAFADAGFSPAIAERLAQLGRLLAHLRETAASCSVAELIRVTVERTGYGAALERDDDSEDRLANIGELITAAQEATGKTEAAGAEEATGKAEAAGSLAALRSFLDRLALLADADTDRADAQGVRLMTVHAAKGLEFSVVFLAGMEEELFPHVSALADGDVEEERRLCYVGMTRARRRLLMSAARSRRINGRERWQEPSRFIGEIDPRNIVVRDYLSPQAVGSKDWTPSSFAGLGGRTGQRQKSRRGYGAGARRSTARRGTARRGTSRSNKNAAAPVRFAGNTRPATEADLTEGAIVVHPMFGPGRVTAAVGSGDKLKLDVRFDKAGTKTVVARYAKLEVPS